MLLLLGHYLYYEIICVLSSYGYGVMMFGTLMIWWECK